LSLVQRKMRSKKKMKDSVFCHFLEANCGMHWKYVWNPMQMKFEYYYSSLAFFQSSPSMIFIFFVDVGTVLRIDRASFLTMFPETLLRDGINIQYYDTMSKTCSGSLLICSELEPKMFQVRDDNDELKNLESLLKKTI
jgi:hypothetical protein